MQDSPDQQHSVLVTGSTGAVGQTAITLLQHRGHDVQGLARRSTPGLPEQRSHIGSITDADAVRRAASDVDTIVHLAATPDDADFLGELYQPNVLGLYNVCEVARERGVRRLVLASSCQLIAHLNVQGRPLKESDGHAPDNHYALTKVWAETMGRMYHDKWGLSVIMARIAFMPRNLHECRHFVHPGVAAWFLSHDDAARYITCCVEADPVDYAVLFATSIADEPRFDLSEAKRVVGYEPRDHYGEGMPFDMSSIVPGSAGATRKRSIDDSASDSEPPGDSNAGVSRTPSRSTAKQTVLVTGAAGTVGRAAVRGLLDAGHTVRSFDRATCPLIEGDANHVGELTDAAAVRRSMQGCDTVVHLAANPGEADFPTDIAPNNVEGNFNVFDAARDLGLKRVVAASTCHVIGKAGPGDGSTITLAHGARPKSFYGLSKRWAEQLGDMYARCYGISVIMVRIGWLPRERAHAVRLGQGDTRVYLSPHDAGRFFVDAVEAEHAGIDVVFVTSRNEGTWMFDPQPARQAVGYEPCDTWPDNLPWDLAQGKEDQS